MTLLGSIQTPPHSTVFTYTTLFRSESLNSQYCHPESSRDLSALGYFDIKNKLRIEPVSVHPHYSVLSPPNEFRSVDLRVDNHQCTKTLSILRDPSKTRDDTSQGG